MDGTCTHENMEIIGEIDTSVCIKCRGALVSNEIEYLGVFLEVGGFCYNKECERYLLLVP